MPLLGIALGRDSVVMSFPTKIYYITSFNFRDSISAKGGFLNQVCVFSSYPKALIM